MRHKESEYEKKFLPPTAEGHYVWVAHWFGRWRCRWPKILAAEWTGNMSFRPWCRWFISTRPVFVTWAEAKKKAEQERQRMEERKRKRGNKNRLLELFLQKVWR
jgi:hypothetical protein